VNDSRKQREVMDNNKNNNKDHMNNVAEIGMEWNMKLNVVSRRIVGDKIIARPPIPIHSSARLPSLRL